MDTACSAIGHTAAVCCEMSTVWGSKTRTTLREPFGLLMGREQAMRTKPLQAIR